MAVDARLALAVAGLAVRPLGSAAVPSAEALASWLDAFEVGATLSC
jgi:hypothetical protein